MITAASKEKDEIDAKVKECKHDDSHDWAKYLPEYVLPRAQATIAKLGAHLVILQAISDAGTCTDFQAIARDRREIAAEFKEMKRVLGVQMGEAQAAVGVDMD